MPLDQSFVKISDCVTDDVMRQKKYALLPDVACS